MNIKDSYIHNGTAVLKDIKIENSILKKILAGKGANDQYLDWTTVLDLTTIKPTNAGNADTLGSYAHTAFLKLTGGTMTGKIDVSYNNSNILDSNHGLNFAQVAHIGIANTDFGIYTTGGIYLRPNQTWGSANSNGLVITSSNITYNTNSLLHAGNYTSYVYSKSQSDGRYVLKAGDTMTGALTVPSLTVTGASTFSQAINGSILGNASTASRLQNIRTITIGSTSNNFDGTSDISFTLALIGAQPAGNYKTIQTAVATVGSSSNTLTFINSISQNTNGVITVTTGVVRDASTSVAGVVNTSAQSFAGTKTFTGDTWGSQIIIKRNGSNDAVIRYDNSNEILGYIGVTSEKIPYWAPDSSHTYFLYHTGNLSPLTTSNYTSYAVSLTGTQTISGNKTFSSSVSIDDLTAGNLVVTGGASFVLTINGNITSADIVNHSLTILLNSGTTEGTNKFTFNGSADKSINITPSAIGAKATQSAVSDPSASGTGISYIATISQNAQGVITATKSTVRSASTSLSGVVTTGELSFAGNKTFTGNITIQGTTSVSKIITATTSSGTNLGVREQRTGGADVGFGVGTGNTNHGVYSYSHSKWLIYSSSSDTNAKVYVNGTEIPASVTLVKSTDIGTAASHAHTDYVTSIGKSGSTITWSKGGTAQTALDFSTTFAAYNSNGYLPLNGGTLTGAIIFDYNLTNGAKIKFKNNRVKSGAEGRSDNFLEIQNAAGTTYALFGHYGDSESDNYIYIGYNAYNGNNLRICSDKITFGSNTVYHTGNLSPMTTSHAANAITSDQITHWDSVYDWLTTTTADTDTTINKWKELEAFLSSITESDTLTGLLANYLPLSGGAMTGSITMADDVALIKSTTNSLSLLGYVKSSTGFTGVSSGFWIGSPSSSIVIRANAAPTIYRGSAYTNLDSGNYSSYALPLSGGTMTGSINASGVSYALLIGSGSNKYGVAIDGSTTGNAILYHNGSSSIVGALHNTTTTTIIRGNDNLIHRKAYDGSADYALLDASNYTDYTVTKAGSGASGTWGISISGNAATATNADTLDGNHATAFVPRKWGNGHYPYIGSCASSAWYKVTFPFSNVSGSYTNNAWEMVSFDIHIGDPYQDKSHGVCHVNYYFIWNNTNKAYTASNVNALLVSTGTFPSFELKYELSNPGILYIHASGSIYNAISIQNLFNHDTARSRNFSSTTIETIAAASVPTGTAVPVAKLNSTSYSGTAASASSVAWANVSGKPSWIGTAKPTYTLDEVNDGTTRKLANYLSLAGGTMNGALTINSNSIGEADHLVFNRGSYNYIRASASGGTIDFIAGGSALAANNIDFSITGSGVVVPAGNSLQLNTLKIPTTSGGSTYGVGSNGQVLKSNGANVYWATDSNSDVNVTQTLSGSGNTDYRPFLVGASYSATAAFSTITSTTIALTGIYAKPSSAQMFINTSDCGITIKRTAASSNAFMKFIPNNGTNYWTIGANVNTMLYAGYNGTEKMGLDNNGRLYVAGQLASGAAQGTAPVSVSSTTVCGSLNADLLDGLHGSYYAAASSLSNYVTLSTAQTISGNKTFSSSVSIDDLTAGNLVVTGGASFAQTINGSINGSANKVNHTLTFTGGVTGTFDGSADKSVAIPTKSSWNYDDTYLKLSGGTLSNSSFGSQLIIERSGSANMAAIGFKNSNGILGYLATNTVNGSFVRYNAAVSASYTILDESNHYSVGVTNNLVNGSAPSYSLSNGAWLDTITLPTTAGSYVLTLISGNSTLTGVFSIGSSDNANDEIALHLHGNGPRLFARTVGTKLQLASNDTSATSRSVTIKYKRLI